MKYVKHFLKQMIFPFLYIVIMMMTSIAITMIDKNLTWLKYILFTLSLGLYGVVIGAIAFKDGQEAVKIRHMNDLERVNIIRTGEDIPLNLVKEYKPYKGFMTGLSACLPLIILMIIHTICILVNPSIRWAGALGSYVYMIVFGFFQPDLSVAVAPEWYFFSLVSIPVFMLLTGVPYMLGARKQALQYKKVEDKHREIYGDKN